MSFIDDLLVTLIQQRAIIPAKDLSKVAADTANYTSDGEPLTADAVKAADLAIIKYVIARIKKAK